MIMYFFGLVVQVGLGLLLGYVLVIVLSFIVFGVWWEGCFGVVWLEVVWVLVMIVVLVVVGGWFGVLGMVVVLVFVVIYGVSGLVLVWIVCGVDEGVVLCGVIFVV